MKRILYFVLTILLFSCSKAQTEKSFVKDCFSKNKSELINKMVSHFEDNICKYYNVEITNSNEAFVAYVNDFANRDENLRTITTKITLDLLKKSNELLRNQVWITYKEKKDLTSSNELIEEIPIITSSNREDEEESKISEQRNKEFDKLLGVNYTGKFAKCLTDYNNNPEFDSMINSMSELGDISPLIIALGLKEFSEKDFGDNAMKTFVAFELYYAILNMMLER